MPTTFVVSDTHFGHAGVCKFLDNNGVKTRPWDDPRQMDLDLIAAWNDTVGPHDKVYHLGDVAMHRKHLAVMQHLNGDKVLIRGNHDTFKLQDYAKHFRDVRGSHYIGGAIMTHIPIRKAPRYSANIHGHTHDSVITMIGADGIEVPDQWYVNVCVERTNWRPIPLDVVLQEIRERRDAGPPNER